MDFAELNISTQHSLAYDVFVHAHAAHTGKSTADIEAVIAHEAFDVQLRDLHAQYLNRAMTLVKMADVLQISTAQLNAVLDAAGLALRGARPRFCNL
jgi:hypothetical protein